MSLELVQSASAIHVAKIVIRDVPRKLVPSTTLLPIAISATFEAGLRIPRILQTHVSVVTSCPSPSRVDDADDQRVYDPPDSSFLLEPFSLRPTPNDPRRHVAFPHILCKMGLLIYDVQP